MDTIHQELLMRVRDVSVVPGPDAPSTGFLGMGTDVDGNTSTIIFAVLVAVVITTIFALILWRKKGPKHILVPLIVFALITVPFAASISAIDKIFTHEETLEFTIARPETEAFGQVDLASFEVPPEVISVENLSEPSIAVNVALVGTVAEINVTIPASVPAGEYTADIIYILPGPSMVYIQDFTPAACAFLETWGGRNGEKIVLKDKRDEQEYSLARLSDGNCWMLNNLKLGSTSGTMTLTPGDTNISSNWTLPQVGISTVDYYDQPVVDGPVPGSSDDINADNFYGYLYNWCGATAGGVASGGADTCTPSSTMPESATGDICPANWRMPAGGDVDFVGNEWSMLSAKMGGHVDTMDTDYLVDYWGMYASFQSDGAWHGTWSGGRYASLWQNQGLSGEWWSSSSYAFLSEYVFGLNVYPNFVHPSYLVDRASRLAMRCLLD